MTDNTTIVYSDIYPYIEKGLITEQSHPEKESLKIFNYTPECQFSRQWDDITTLCRGLILDTETDTIVARPFPKFFNYDEYQEFGGVLPDENPNVYEKMDGSLGILYYLDGEPRIATRGSFTSDQAKWATEWWHKNVQRENKFKHLPLTHLFEIIYDDNRIVVNYDFEGLVYLATLHNETGRTIKNVHWPEVTSVKEHPSNNIEVLKEVQEIQYDNKEGFVLHYPSSELRVKIKFDEYIRLHKILTGLSEKGLWEMLQDKGLEITAKDVVEDVPDEFFSWMEFVLERMKSEYKEIENEALRVIKLMEGEIRPGGAYEDRKHQAELIKTCKYPSIAFAMLDEKDYSSQIFKLIKPQGPQKYT